MRGSFVVMNLGHSQCYAARARVRLAHVLALVLVMLGILCWAPSANAQNAAQPPAETASAPATNPSAAAVPGRDGGDVMKDFVALEQANREQAELTTQKKHTIMFIMGVALLILLLATAYFGIAMAVMGKPRFIPHMVCAGLSVTLAIAHSVVAMVWFYPF